MNNLKNKSNLKLLPPGFCDLIGEEAKINHDINNKIIKNFQDYGYQLVKTPLVEYEETFENYQKLNQKSFYVSDLSSKQKLIFRNDITVQIARLVNTRLKNLPSPLKICYLGDVIRVDDAGLHSDKQQTHLGIELIGGDSIKSDEEVINITFSSLINVGTQDLTIEFCYPKFIDLLIKELNLDNNQDLHQAIKQKNIDKIRQLTADFSEEIINLVLEINDPKKIQNILKNLPLSKNLQSLLNNVFVLIENVLKKYPEVLILLNIFADTEFIYHKNIAFTIFCQKSNNPIARGGRYQINDNLVATGSTIYGSVLTQSNVNSGS